MTVLNPANQQWGRIEPYISLAAFKASPTASLLNFSTFVENGDQDDQDAALWQLILRASSKVDVHTMGRLGTLNATQNIENGQIVPDRMGRFIIHPEYSPILEVSAFQWGATPSMGNVVQLSNANCFVERENIFVTATGAGESIAYSGIGALSSIIQGRGNYGRTMYCQWTYVNGWANTFSTAETNPGDSSMEVTDPTGIYPGNQLYIWDGSNDEVVVVSSDYVAGDSTVTFASPLLFGHAVGTNLSALPASIGQAVIHFVVSMVSQRGETGFVLDDSGEAKSVDVGGSKDGHEIMAYDLLDNFVRTWGRT